MKTSLSSKYVQFARALAIAAALAVASNASAATPNLTKLAGTFTGSYSASGAFITYSGASSGPSTAKFKSTQKGAAGKLSLSGTDTANEGGGSYTATIQFKKGGACTTDAIVPGIVNVAGTGTWKASGKKIKFTLEAFTPAGTIKAVGTVKASGKNLNIISNGTLSGPFGSGSGQYNFQGAK